MVPSLTTRMGAACPYVYGAKYNEQSKSVNAIRKFLDFRFIAS